MANEKYKSKVRGFSREDLFTEIEDKKKELSKRIIEARKYGYVPTQASTYHGNIERTKKQIAILETFLNKIEQS